MYRSFENRFRGPKEEVKGKLKVYIPILNTLKGKKALDLGCGRGEFLELLNEYGIEGVGVDIETSMTDSENVVISDALEFLRKQKDKSFSLITAFHMIEHVDIDYLLLLIKEAKRVLDDEGFLIFETPNPENLRVASEYFYLDPTHKRPVPKELLRFLLEYEGFYTRIWLLNSQKHSDITDIFNAVSFDYAAVASKKPHSFIKEGISIDMVLKDAKAREEAQQNTNRFILNELKKQYDFFDERIIKTEEKINHLLSFLSQIQDTLNAHQKTIEKIDLWVKKLNKNIFIKILKKSYRILKKIKNFCFTRKPPMSKRAYKIYKDLKRKNR